MLKAEGEMPIKYDEFLRSCKGNVSPSKYALLEKLSVNSAQGPLVKEWAEFYRRFNGELTFQRKKKLGQSVNQYTDKDDEASKAISAALSADNPLSGEIILLSFLFKKLDGFIGTHVFDDYALFGYALKLKLLERKTVFDLEAGKKELNRLVKNIERQISEI